MHRNRVPNHLRAFRKRFHLSQAELAYLLGCEDAAKISHYERFKRVPSLETALRFQALFGTTMEKLFPGMTSNAKRAVCARLGRFMKRRSTQTASGHKRQAIQDLASRQHVRPSR